MFYCLQKLIHLLFSKILFLRVWWRFCQVVHVRENMFFWMSYWKNIIFAKALQHNYIIIWCVICSLCRLKLLIFCVNRYVQYIVSDQISKTLNKCTFLILWKDISFDGLDIWPEFERKVCEGKFYLFQFGRNKPVASETGSYYIIVLDQILNIINFWTCIISFVFCIINMLFRLHTSMMEKENL